MVPKAPWALPVLHPFFFVARGDPRCFGAGLSGNRPSSAKKGASPKVAARLAALTGGLCVRREKRDLTAARRPGARASLSDADSVVQVSQHLGDPCKDQSASRFAGEGRAPFATSGAKKPPPSRESSSSATPWRKRLGARNRVLVGDC